MHILLVDSDETQGASICARLKRDKHTVDVALRGDTAEFAMLAIPYDCVLLERRLPVLSGDEVLRRLRAADNMVPVLMIAHEGSHADRVAGLDLGADDYMVKPVELDELSARIRAIVRRGPNRRDYVLSHAGVELDPAGRSASQRGIPISLTPREFNVLYALLLNKHAILSRKQLEQSIYGWNDEIDSNAIEVYVGGLRRKLGNEFIVTVRGLGYRLVSIPL